MVSSKIQPLSSGSSVRDYCFKTPEGEKFRNAVQLVGKQTVHYSRGFIPFLASPGFRSTLTALYFQSQLHSSSQELNWGLMEWEKTQVNVLHNPLEDLQLLIGIGTPLENGLLRCSKGIRTGDLMELGNPGQPSLFGDTQRKSVAMLLLQVEPVAKGSPYGSNPGDVFLAGPHTYANDGRGRIMLECDFIEPIWVEGPSVESPVFVR